MTRAVVELPCEAGSIRLARRLLGELMRGADPAAEQVALLLLSELATNSVVHARSAFTVTMLVGPECVHVGVSDSDSRLPIMRHYGRDAVTGRGIQLVEGQSSRWGVEEQGGEGKTVWFELDDWQATSAGAAAG